MKNYWLFFFFLQGRSCASNMFCFHLATFLIWYVVHYLVSSVVSVVTKVNGWRKAVSAVAADVDVHQNIQRQTVVSCFMTGISLWERTRTAAKMLWVEREAEPRLLPLKPHLATPRSRMSCGMVRILSISIGMRYLFYFFLKLCSILQTISQTIQLLVDPVQI